MFWVSEYLGNLRYTKVVYNIAIQYAEWKHQQI